MSVKNDPNNHKMLDNAVTDVAALFAQLHSERYDESRHNECTCHTDDNEECVLCFARRYAWDRIEHIVGTLRAVAAILKSENAAMRERVVDVNTKAAALGLDRSKR